jgi:hypothetical protein
MITISAPKSHFGRAITSSNVDSVFNSNKKTEAAWYPYLSNVEKTKLAELQKLQASFWKRYFTTMRPAPDVNAFDPNTLPQNLKTLWNNIKVKIDEIFPAVWQAMQRHAAALKAQSLFEKSNETGPLRLADINPLMPEKSRKILEQVNKLRAEFNQKYQAKNPNLKDKNEVVWWNRLDDELMQLMKMSNTKFREWSSAYYGPPSTWGK